MSQKQPSETFPHAADNQLKISLSARKTKSMNANGYITSAVLIYLVSDAMPDNYTDEEILTAVLDNAPERVGSAALISAEITEYHGAGVYEIEVNYEYQASSSTVRFCHKRPKDEKWYLASSNTVEHILVGHDTRGYGNEPPIPGNMINWNGKFGSSCSAAGANILTSTLRENCILTIRSSDYTASFRKKILAVTGNVNSSAFHGWAAGEVLFLGGSSGMPYVNDEGVELMDITLKFAIRPNRENVYVNGRFISVKGWEMIWPLGFDYVYVSQVYPLSDLNILGVGR